MAAAQVWKGLPYAFVHACVQGLVTARVLLLGRGLAHAPHAGSGQDPRSMQPPQAPPAQAQGTRLLAEVQEAGGGAGGAGHSGGGGGGAGAGQGAGPGGGASGSDRLGGPDLGLGLIQLLVLSSGIQQLGQRFFGT